MSSVWTSDRGTSLHERPLTAAIDLSYAFCLHKFVASLGPNRDNNEAHTP